MARGGRQGLLPLFLQGEQQRQVGLAAATLGRLGVVRPAHGTAHGSGVFEVEEDVGQLIRRRRDLVPPAVGQGHADALHQALDLRAVLRGSVLEQSFGLLQQGPSLHRLALALARPGDQFVEPAEGEMPILAPGPREGQREAVQARALLEKAERLLERTQPEDRVEVERLMTAVRTALTDRQWDRLTAACNELADTLFYLEDS